MHYYKRNLGDYAKKCGHLSALEHGVYNLLLDAYYDRERAPTRVDALRIARARSQDEIEAVDSVLAQFFTADGEMFVQKRVQEEIEAFRAMAEVNRAIAIKREDAKRQRASHEPSTNRAPTVNESSTLSARPVQKREPNHKPLTINQEPEDQEQTVAIATVVASKPATPPCPHEEIIAAYHDELPMLARVREWTEKRQAKLSALWKSDTKRQTVDFWRRYFKFVATDCHFLTGNADNQRTWRADLEWLVTKSNFVKVSEGAYQNRNAA